MTGGSGGGGDEAGYGPGSIEAYSVTEEGMSGTPVRSGKVVVISKELVYYSS